MIFRNMFKMVSGAAMLVLVLLVSCSKVKFAGKVETVDGDMNHSSYVRFDVDWTSAGVNKPDEMTVLMNRIQNVTVHYAWRVDNMGEPIASVSVPDAQEGAEDVPGMLVKNGLYTMMGVAAQDPEDFVIPDVEVYEDSLGYRTKDVYVVIPEVPDSVRFKQNLIDLNPMCPFIRAVDPIYFIRSDNNALVSQVKESEIDGRVTIPLAPQKLTHNFNFMVLLKTEDPSRADGSVEEVKDSVVGVVYLDTLKAAISGVPTKAQLMSGYVTDQKTGKIGFHLKKNGETRVSDGSSELNLYEGTYEGSVNALGLFPPMDSEYLAGSGILNIFLYPKIYYENAYGEKIALSRVFHASLNIKEEIDAAKIMVQVPDRDYYMYAKEGDTELMIRTSIVLSYDDVLSGSSQGLKEWTTNELYPDDFNPGLEM